MYGISQSQENCRSHNGRKKSMEKEITKKIRVYGPSADMQIPVKSGEASVTVDLMWKFLHREARRQ